MAFNPSGFGVTAFAPLPAPMLPRPIPDRNTTDTPLKQINDVERETALLMLVTEWRHGELAPPRERAWRVANYGIEAGMGMELSPNLELAVLWANELTQGPGRAAVLQQAAATML